MSAHLAGKPDVANLAHDLRVPLNSIKSWAQVLESFIEDPDPIVARAIAGILTGVDQQVAVIERIEHPERK